jgi:hypothetical protein
MEPLPDGHAAPERHQDVEEAVTHERESLRALKYNVAAMERELCRSRLEARATLAICFVFVATLLLVAFLATS